jgi:hypothetical protein
MSHNFVRILAAPSSGGEVAVRLRLGCNVMGKPLAPDIFHFRGLSEMQAMRGTLGNAGRF